MQTKKLIIFIEPSTHTTPTSSSLPQSCFLPTPLSYNTTHSLTIATLPSCETSPTLPNECLPSSTPTIIEPPSTHTTDTTPTSSSLPQSNVLPTALAFHHHIIQHIHQLYQLQAQNHPLIPQWVHVPHQVFHNQVINPLLFETFSFNISHTTTPRKATKGRSRRLSSLGKSLTADDALERREKERKEKFLELPKKQRERRNKKRRKSYEQKKENKKN